MNISLSTTSSLWPRLEMMLHRSESSTSMPAACVRILGVEINQRIDHQGIRRKKTKRFGSVALLLFFSAIKLPNDLFLK